MKFPKRYSRVVDGQWVQPRPRGYLMACCDCGLVHRMNFRVATAVRRGKVIRTAVQFQAFQAFRAERLTARLRREMGPKR